MWVNDVLWLWLVNHLSEHMPSIVLAGLIIGLAVVIQKVAEKRRT